jgi:WhiB family redox-sensing transcriptional regulator
MNVARPVRLPPFRFDALCRQVDPALFFPDHGQHGKQAKDICAACPVLDACLAYALRQPKLEGVWGGTSKQDRERIRREQRAAA